MAPLSDLERRELERRFREESRARLQSQNDRDLENAAAYAAISIILNKIAETTAAEAELNARTRASVEKIGRSTARLNGVLAHPAFRLIVQAVVALGTAYIATKKGV